MKSPQRGQIFRLKTDSVGKPRPVLIVSPAHLNGGTYLTAVPFYSDQAQTKRSYRQCVFFARGEYGLEKDCVAKADEVSLYKFSELRIAEGQLGLVDGERMEEISIALSYALGITPHCEPEKESPVSA